MELLAALGLLEILRAAFFAFLALFLPGYFFIRLDEKRGFLAKLLGKVRGAETEHRKLFEGAAELVAGSVFFSIIISAILFSILAFTIGLDFLTALVSIVAVIAIEAYLVWKEKR